jgi:hypothetical protein
MPPEERRAPLDAQHAAYFLNRPNSLPNGYPQDRFFNMDETC